MDQIRGVPTLFAVSYADALLCELIDASGFERIEIGTVAAEADSYQAVFCEWTRVLAPRFDWVIDVNLICRPFLRLETLIRLVDRAAEAEEPFVVCTKERGILWDGNGTNILGDGQVADTKNNPLYFRLAHLGYAHPASLWEESDLSLASRPVSIELAPEERIDIDTPEDLVFAKVVYAGLVSSSSQSVLGSPFVNG